MVCALGHGTRGRGAEPPDAGAPDVRPATDPSPKPERAAESGPRPPVDAPESDLRATPDAGAAPVPASPHDARRPDARARAPEAAAASPLLALDALSLQRCLAWVPDPSAAAAACKALARVACAADEDFALQWFSSGAASRGPPGCCGTRAVASRLARGRTADGLARWLIRVRRAARAAAALRGGAEGAAGGEARRAAAESVEQQQEEEDALLLLERGRPCVALMLLAGPYSQHLLLPLVARCGDLPLVRELVLSEALPARPMLLEGDASTKHYVLATAARAAMRGGRVEVARWLVERLLAHKEEGDVDRTDPACQDDPFALLRFCCRHGTAACLVSIPSLRKAALAAVARGAPAVLPRQVAMAAAGRADAEGVALARALVEMLPGGSRPGICWLMLPFGCRGGYAPMQELMVRLAERHGLMSCLPGQMAQSTSAMREVLSAAMACSPPVPDDALVQFIRAALQTVLGQPLVEAGQGDSVETAEALWGAARARGVEAAVTARLQLPPSVPARVWLERRRVEGAGGAAGGGGGGDRGRGGGGGGGAGGALQRWMKGLRGGGGGAAAGSEAPRDPPLSHMTECLEGIHGAAALEAAQQLLASAHAAGGGGGGADASAAEGGGGGAAGGGGTWLSLRERVAVPGGAAVAAAAAVGQAIVAAAGGDAARIAALWRQRDERRWAHEGYESDEEEEAVGRCASGPALPGQLRRSSGGGGSAALPEPGGLGFDKMLVAAAKHGHASVLRTLLPPLVGWRGVGDLQSRGALLMAIALQRRQRDLVRVLAQHGLAARAADGYRLLQTQPPRDGGRGDAPAPPLPAPRAPATQQKARGAAARAPSPAAARGATAAAARRGEGWGSAERRAAREQDADEVEQDAALALALLQGAKAGGRNERLLNSWLTSAATQPEGGALLCGRRCAAVLRGVCRAAELPVGARVAAPRALLKVALLPTADLDVLEAVFEWLERADLVAE